MSLDGDPGDAGDRELAAAVADILATPPDLTRRAVIDGLFLGRGYR